MTFDLSSILDAAALLAKTAIAVAPEVVKLVKGTHADLRAGTPPTWRARQDGVDAEIERRGAAAAGAKD